MAPDIDLTETSTVDHQPLPTPDAVGTSSFPSKEVVFDVDDLNVYYGAFRAVRNIDITVHRNEITAFIGPSGCGKTTVLRCFNRMNDLIEIARVEGKVRYHGIDLYDRE